MAGKVRLDGAPVSVSRELLARMVTALAHRGPEEHGIYRDPCAGLAHARLALTDIEGGQQPMGDATGTRWLVFNGEIFNHVELRQELARAGYSFRTRSDTEVVLQAYAAWGTGCFRRFNGQWAIALWDSAAQALVLARDPFGICPLYTVERNRTVWFSSEVKGLFVDPEVPRALDPAGIDQVFTYWAPLAPTTVFEGVVELRPGTVRVYRRDLPVSESTFWEPSYPEAGAPPRWSLDEATEILAAELAEATRLRLTRADVPVGAYLSGGLDSAVVATLARRATSELHTFSLAFEDAEFDERQHQRTLAASLGSRHATIVVDRTDVAAVFPDVIEHTERPLLRTAPAPLFLLSRLVRETGIKAVLTGEGADEMLAGYDIFREAKIRAFWARRPESTIRPLLFDRLYPYLARSPARAKGMAQAFWRRGLDNVGAPGWSHDLRWSTTAMIKRMFSADLAASIAAQQTRGPLDALPARFGSWDDLSQAQHLEVTTLLSPYLLSSQGDRMLLAHSVEGRFPFLDPDVVDFCNALPPRYKLSHLDEKHVLKRVAGDFVPPEIVRRKKQAYRAPDAMAFASHGSVIDLVEDMLGPARVGAIGLFEPRAVAGLLEKMRRLAKDPSATFGNSDNMALVGILSTHLVHQRFISPSNFAEPYPPMHELRTDVDRTTAARS